MQGYDIWSFSSYPTVRTKPESQSQYAEMAEQEDSLSWKSSLVCKLTLKPPFNGLLVLPGN